MSSIDPEAAGILIENGLDVPTALAGSVIENQSPLVPSRNAAPVLTIGVLIGLATVLAYVVWRSL